MATNPVVPFFIKQPLLRHYRNTEESVLNLIRNKQSILNSLDYFSVHLVPDSPISMNFILLYFEWEF